MKRLSILAVVLGLACVVPALGEDATNRPNGVTAQEWVAISDDLGLVVLAQKPAEGQVQPRVDRLALLVQPPVNGYFMVRRGKQWQRLLVVEPIRG